MKPEELRIGNYFQWNEFASMGRGIDRITHGQQIEDYISFKEPIPLTEQWLKYFGFKDDTEKWHTSKVFTKDRYSYWIGSEVDDNALFRNDKLMAKCEHVHQLQNLYYALTGNELTKHP